MVFLTTLCFIGYCFAFKRITRWSIEAIPFFVISLLISLLYGAAYFNYLHVASLVLLGLGLGCLLLAPLYIQRHHLYSQYLTSGFVLLFVMSLLFAVVAQGSHLYLWDEFTQWGAHAKFISATGGLWNTSIAVIHPTYPPAAALFYYLFYPFSGYTEGKVYFAQQLLILLPLGVLLKDISWNKWPRAFLMLAFATIILMVLHVHMGAAINLYLDGIVGVYFGMCLLHSRQVENNFMNTLYFVPILFAFMLLKVKLLAFALLILLFMLCGGISSATPLLLFLILPIMGAHFSWQHYIDFVPPKMLWHLHTSLAGVSRDLFALNFTKSQELTIIKFAWTSLKLLPFVVVVLGLAFWNYKILPNALDRRRIFIDQLLLSLGFIGFLASLLIMYLFAFGAHEGTQLASFARYTEIYFVAWTVFTYGHLMPALLKAEFAWKKKISSILTGGLLLGFPVFLMASHASRLHRDRKDHSLWRMQKVIRRIAKNISVAVPKNAKVFTVWQSSTGLERSILTYELIPRALNPNANSYGTPYYAGDVWTKDLSTAAFLKAMSGYDYLLLGYTDKNFWQHYGRLFSQQAESQPFAQYLLCKAPEFNGFQKPGCTMQPESIYLFKIVKKDNKVALEQVVS